MPGSAARPDPEVVAVARRRQFSIGQKRALLAEADRCKAAGTLGAFLRSERIYSSMLSSWRRQVEAADRVALAPKKRGQKAGPSARHRPELPAKALQRRYSRAGLDERHHVRCHSRGLAVPGGDHRRADPPGARLQPLGSYAR